MPTDDPEALATAFQILDDWASGMTLDPVEIDKERGVVLEEWRQSLGPGQRMRDQLVQLTYAGSPYPERLPIGTEDSLRTFQPEALRRFYSDWYRPDLMSVIVVGDLDVAETVATIESHFGDIAMPTEPRERVRPAIPPHAETLSLLVTDPQAQAATVSLMHHRDMIDGVTYRAYCQRLLDGLVANMINLRLQDRAQEADHPFLGSGVGDQRLTPIEGADIFVVGAQPDAIPTAVRAAWTEVVRARQHGFSEAEFDTVKGSLLRSFETYESEVETTESVSHAEELIRHVTVGETVPGVLREVALVREWIPQMTVAEANAVVARFLPNSDRVLTATMPEIEGLVAPTTGELLAIIAEVEATRFDPPEVMEPVGEPVTTPPEAGTITHVDTQYEAALGFTGWTLSNGVKVWFRRTEFKADEIVLKGFSPGGHRMVDDADYIALKLADNVKSASGWGALDASQWRRYAADRTVSLSFSVSPSFDNVSGSSATDDLELLLSLIWQASTDPRFTQEGLNTLMEGRRASMSNQEAQPDWVFGRDLKRAAWPASPRKQSWLLEDVEAAANVDRMRELFVDRYGDLGDAQFFLAGNLPDDDTLTRLVTTWLGGLPTEGRAEVSLPRPMSPTKGPITVITHKGTDPKAEVDLEWRVPFDDQSWLTRNRLQGVEAVLSVKLREILREDLGGVYGVSVSTSTDSVWPEPAGYVFIGFQCDPERVDELIDATLDVVDEVRTTAADPRYIDEEIAKRSRGRQDAMQTNDFWAGGLEGALRRGEDPLEILNYDERNASLTPDEVQQAAERFLPERTPWMRGVLLPEEPE